MGARGSMWWGQRGSGGSMIESWGQAGNTGEHVGHRDIQGEQGSCQDQGCTLTRVCSSESPVSAAMRHSVVGSGCLFTLQKLYSRISSCSSVGVTGFSVAISSWGKTIGPSTVERGWRHCPNWERPRGHTCGAPDLPSLCPPAFPSLVASGCSRVHFPSQWRARDLS